ncbi:MAG: hypothetical protein KatS3mg019_0306 [Fimbriimonadales bacterium]|nr:MAG: hypothetical protein KatS3mg019_0306 [Fimbriimonadales bacterium]
MRRTILSGAVLFAAFWTVHAQVLYSTSFDDFNLGSINTQFGWQQQISTTGPGSGDIVNTLARSASQSLKITPINGTGTGSNWW